MGRGGRTSRRGEGRRNSKQNGGDGVPPKEAKKLSEPAADQADEPKGNFWTRLKAIIIRPPGTWAEIVIAGFTIVLGVVSLLQWSQQDRQLTIQEKMLQRSLTGMVSIDPIPQIGGYSVGQEPTAFLTVENVGPIPVKAQMYIRTEIVPRDSKRQSWSDYKRDPSYGGRAIIAPGKAKNTAVKWDKLDAKTLAELKDGYRELQVTAVAEFTDGTDEVRTEPFCAKWYGPPGMVPEYCPTE